MNRSPDTVSGGLNPIETIFDVLIGWPARIAAYFGWLGPLVARIVVGSVFLWSGWGKLGDLPTVIDNFIGWGIPFAKILAPFVSGVELIGGILLLLGLFTRIAAMPLVIVIIVAIISAKWDEVDSLETLLGIRVSSAFLMARGRWSRSDFARSSVAARGAGQGNLTQAHRTQDAVHRDAPGLALFMPVNAGIQ